MSDSSRRIALITGANKGIGFETARQLGKQGVAVLIGARDAVRGAAAVSQLKTERSDSDPSSQSRAATGGIDARLVQLDVTSAESVSAAAAAIEREFGRLDILVNNAGVLDYASEATPATVSMETLRRTFEVNFFGMVAVTQALLPLLRKSPAGRIVNLTSILASLAEHADPNSPIFNSKHLAYDASKAAVNMFTNHLAHELRGTPIKVNAAHPGWVKTDMGGPEAPMDIADGAKTSVMLATLPDAGPSGGFYHMGVHMRW